MKKIKTISIILAALMFFIFQGIATAETLAPDRSQQVLDLLALGCQKINDYSLLAQYGDTSSYESVRDQIAVMINNVSLLMNGYDNAAVNDLWNMFNQFQSDAQSAQRASELCSTVRGNIYRKISNDENMNQYGNVIGSFDDCVRAGYHVNGGTCFIGGTSVFDNNGNLIGYYFSDCFDQQGFHPGSCWDCFYGANNEGCIAKP